jgi:hypothetical protein
MVKKWQPLDLSQLPDCAVLACDPSLAACGIVWVVVEDGRVTVRGAEKLATVQTDRRGWDDTFYRARLLEALLASLVSHWTEEGSLAHGLYGVHEAPPAGGGDFTRIESSILAGYAFRSVCDEHEIKLAKTVTPQSHKKLICGNHIASKREHHESLKKLLPRMDGGNKIRNEATRDALSIALYTAWRYENG